MKEKEVNTGLPKERAINLSDFAFFLAVMQNKDAYESVLGIILEEEDLELKEVKVEQLILSELYLSRRKIFLERNVRNIRLRNSVKK